MCVGQWIEEGKAGVQRGCDFPSLFFLWWQRRAVPHVPVLGIPVSFMTGCKSSPSSGKDEPQSGGEGN